MSDSLHYIEGSTKLYNGSFPKGFLVDSDELVASGIDIGHYEPSANALIRFQAEVVDENNAEIVNDDNNSFIGHNEFMTRSSFLVSIAGHRGIQSSATVIIHS